MNHEQVPVLWAGFYRGETWYEIKYNGRERILIFKNGEFLKEYDGLYNVVQDMVKICEDKPACPTEPEKVEVAL